MFRAAQNRLVLEKQWHTWQHGKFSRIQQWRLTSSWSTHWGLRALGSCGLLLIDRALIVFGFVEQPGKCGLTRVSVQGIGVTFECDPVQQALNIYGSRIGRPIECVTDMSKSRRLGFATYRATDEAFFRSLCKTAVGPADPLARAMAAGMRLRNAIAPQFMIHEHTLS